MSPQTTLFVSSAISLKAFFSGFSSNGLLKVNPWSKLVVSICSYYSRKIDLLLKTENIIVSGLKALVDLARSPDMQCYSVVLECSQRPMC
jgi:hypothetical protein